MILFISSCYHLVRFIILSAMFPMVIHQVWIGNANFYYLFDIFIGVIVKAALLAVFLSVCVFKNNQSSNLVQL